MGSDFHLSQFSNDKAFRAFSIVSLLYFTSDAEKYGFSHKHTFYRTIANKAMSLKNAPENISNFSGDTMNQESIIIWKF